MEGDMANVREKLRFAAIKLEMIKPFKNTATQICLDNSRNKIYAKDKRT